MVEVPQALYLVLHFDVHIFAPFKQERAFGELEKNSDKHLSNESHRQTDPPSHFHQLLTGLHKHLLAHCYIHPGPEVNCAISLAQFFHGTQGHVVAF